MATHNTAQSHRCDFTAAEVAGFIAAALGNIMPDCCVLVAGEGKVREATGQRVQAKMQKAKVDNITALPASDQPSGLHLSFMVDKQMLDDWLRPQIPDLPEIGKYIVVQPPRNPDVALLVRWVE